MALWPPIGLSGALAQGADPYAATRAWQQAGDIMGQDRGDLPAGRRHPSFRVDLRRRGTIQLAGRIRPKGPGQHFDDTVADTGVYSRGGDIVESNSMLFQARTKVYPAHYPDDYIVLLCEAGDTMERLLTIVTTRPVPQR